MQAVVWRGPEDVRVETVDEPELLDPDDAILEVSTAAICGSDLHLVRGKLPRVAPGTIIGHEFCGTVLAVGDGVRRIRAGDRCVAAMHTACGRCPACLGGEHARCAAYAMFGCGALFGDLAGGQAERVRVPLADMTLAPIPTGLADQDVIFVGDILATAYTACVEAAVVPGDTVAVVGCGPVGQLILDCLRLFQPAVVYAIDPVPARLAQAAARGAVPLDGATDPLEALRAHTGGRRADVVMEAVGSADGLAAAWRLVDTGGRLALVGLLVDEPFPETAGRTWLRCLTIRSVLGRPYRHRERLLRLIERGRLHPAAIVSETVPLAAAADAYRRLLSRSTSKVLLTP